MGKNSSDFFPDLFSCRSFTNKDNDLYGLWCVMGPVKIKLNHSL